MDRVLATTRLPVARLVRPHERGSGQLAVERMCRRRFVREQQREAVGR
jgi:hypothetical protein